MPTLLSVIINPAAGIIQRACVKCDWILFTKESFQFDVSGNEVVELDVAVLVGVPHDDRIERRIAHTETCAPTGIDRSEHQP